MESILEALTAILIVLKEMLRAALAGLADLLKTALAEEPESVVLVVDRLATLADLPRAALEAQAICLGPYG